MSEYQPISREYEDGCYGMLAFYSGRTEANQFLVEPELTTSKVPFASTSVTSSSSSSLKPISCSPANQQRLTKLKSLLSDYHKPALKTIVEWLATSSTSDTSVTDFFAWLDRSDLSAEAVSTLERIRFLLPLLNASKPYLLPYGATANTPIVTQLHAFQVQQPKQGAWLLRLSLQDPQAPVPAIKTFKSIHMLTICTIFADSTILNYRVDLQINSNTGEFQWQIVARDPVKCPFRTDITFPSLINMVDSLKKALPAALV